MSMHAVTSPVSSPAPTQWTAPSTASWTIEEIEMIQEMFLSDENAIQIHDINICDGKQPIVKGPVAISVEQGIDATSMLLSPIGADDAFPKQFMMDEKDAMVAISHNTIGPLKNASVASEQEPVLAVSAVLSNGTSRPSAGRPVDRVLAKLRVEVDTLNRIYYSRWINVSGASLNKVKLMLAIERLQRVIQGLSTEKDRLKTDTTSCAQRCELLLQQNRNSGAELEPLRRLIKGSMCAVAVTEGMNMTLNYSMDGKVLKDHESNYGWGYKSIVSSDGMFKYSLSKEFSKEFSKEVNMHDVMQKSWATVSSSENVSSIYYGAIKAEFVKKVGKEAVIMYDIANYNATRVDRVVAVLYRVKTVDGFLLGARSLDVPLTSTCKNVSRMKCTIWQQYKYTRDGGFSITSCGQLSYPSQADMNFMAMEILCLHLRWESRVVGPQLMI